MPRAGTGTTFPDDVLATLEGLFTKAFACGTCTKKDRQGYSHSLLREAQANFESQTNVSVLGFKASTLLMKPFSAIRGTQTDKMSCTHSGKLDLGCSLSASLTTVLC